MRIFTVASLAALAVLSSAQVPGRVTARYTEQPGVLEFSGQMIARPVQINDLLNKGFSYEEAVARHDRASRLVASNKLWYIPATDEYVIKVPIAFNENTTSEMLMSTGCFSYVEPDWICYPTATPNDALYPSQWAPPKINLPTAWNYFIGTGSVVTAITDTGIRLDHEDLAARLVPGANSATGVIITQQNGGQVNDINGHGSHCAGIAAAIGNNGVGVCGVNWNGKLMPVRVTNSSGGGSNITALTEGARWAADNGARVVSTSYSGVNSATVDTTGTYIKTMRNGVYCWAAGNSATNLSNFDYLDVTIVGASDQNDNRASFSSYGHAVDVFAPGVNILSCYNTSASSYVFLDGTSMATPMVAGLASLVTGTNLSLSAQEVETILYETAKDLGAVGNDDVFGWGRIDAAAAVQRSYNTKAFAASGFTVVKGSLQSGGVPELVNSDDQKVKVAYAISASAGDPVVVEFQTNTTNMAPGRIDFILESSSNSNSISQRTEMFDYVSNAWVVVDTRLATTSDQTITITPANSTRYRQAGTGLMKTRVAFNQVAQNALRSFTVSFDRVAWMTAP